MYSTLISIDDLAAHHSFVVVDCRHSLSDFGAGSRAYRESHLPGAHFLHMEHDLSGPKTGRNGRHPLPDPRMLAAKLGALGIDASRQIVAYDQNNGMFASRLWWLARWLGHKHVAVLDGGFDAWRNAGMDVSGVPPSPVPAHFELRPSLELAVPASELLGAVGSTLLDARAADRFRGRNETIDPVSGHIPGGRVARRIPRRNRRARSRPDRPLLRLGNQRRPQPARDGNRRTHRQRAVRRFVERVDRRSRASHRVLVACNSQSRARMARAIRQEQGAPTQTERALCQGGATQLSPHCARQTVWIWLLQATRFDRTG
jgi:thiosulfate/3-mercaptopyruvate sulfurtransferase